MMLAHCQKNSSRGVSPGSPPTRPVTRNACLRHEGGGEITPPSGRRQTSVIPTNAPKPAKHPHA